MNSINVSHDLATLTALYKKYFKYARKRELSKIPSVGIIVMGALFSLAGMLFSLHLLIYLGIITLAFLGAFLFYFRIKFQRAFHKLNRDLQKNEAVTPKSIQFSFDDDGMSYISMNSSHRFNWDHIANYAENKGDIYLFTASHELFDIISTALIGETNFQLFRTVLDQKCTPIKR